MLGEFRTLKRFHHVSIVTRSSNFNTKLIQNPPTLHLHIKQTNKQQQEEEEGGMRDESGGGRDPGSAQTPGARPGRRFNGNNQLLSEAIRAALDGYLPAEPHCSI